MKTILYLEDRNGFITTQTVENISLEDAQEKYDSLLFKVITVKDDIPGEYDNKMAFSIIQNEGIGYAVLNYTDFTNFSKRKTRNLWRNAALALKNLQEHLA
jgi:hypothetical protein